MTNRNDFTKALADAVGAATFDADAVREAFKTNAKFGEEFSRVVLDAAKQSTEISSKWAKDALSGMGDVASVKEEPTEYTKALTDFASAQAESATEHMAAFAEVAKRVQMETVELMMNAGKNASDDATPSAKKAAPAAKKAAPAAKGGAAK